MPGGHERDFLRIDRMVLAVVDDHAHVLQREARDRRLSSAPARRPSCTAGINVLRNRAALDLVDELEAGAARQRLDLQEHLAELAGAAGLLLVAMMPFGLAR